jgi:hypothetical protein
MSTFIPGLELSRLFYQEAVRPIIDATLPGLPHSAALVGRGSEVLGFDDEMSPDHYYSARILIFLRGEDDARHGKTIDEALRQGLPPRFRDYPIDFGYQTLRDFILEHLNFDIDNEIEPADWLTFSEQQLCMITGGAVYHDGIGLQAVRDRFAYYPHDVWLYLLSAAWCRLHPEGNLVGRAGFVGDELGSALIGSRLVHDLMHLCFLMEKKYAPFSKWYGSAFARLACAAELSPRLWKALRAETWPERESALMAAYEQVAAMHNALGITEPVLTEVRQMWKRPFKVVWGDFPGALSAQIKDPAVKRISERWPFGGIDQIREILWGPRSRRRLLRLIEDDRR